jgi:hypothetical protein
MKTTNPYNTRRKMAFRNLMVAAVNAAVEQRLFDPTDRNASERRRDADAPAFRWDFVFPGGAPGIGYAHDIGCDEMAVSAALYPGPRGREFLGAILSRFSPGDVSATGWLSLGPKPSLQSGMTALFYCRARHLNPTASAVIPPLGFSDVDKRPKIALR